MERKGVYQYNRCITLYDESDKYVQNKKKFGTDAFPDKMIDPGLLKIS